MDISFKKYFKEPSIKYNCFSISLFYLEKYLKTDKYLKLCDVSEKKINVFYENLLKIDEFLKDGTYPKDFYVRFYFDKSVFKSKKYLEILKLFSKNNKVQLIEYNWKELKMNNIHVNLAGTFARFYTIFDSSSHNMEYCVLADADNIFTKNFFNIFNEFKKSNNLVYTFNSINQTVFHANDFPYNNDFYNYIYLPAGFTIVKKDRIFEIKYWNKYFTKMYEQNDLVYLYNYMDFKKYSFTKLLGRTHLKLESNYLFCYGTDEIWLNFIIKKILIDNNKINKLDVYIVNDYDLKMLLFKLNDIFNINHITNLNFSLFIKECTFLKNKNYDSLELYIKKIENNEDEIISFLNIIKNNKYFNRLYIQNNLKYIILHLKELLKKRKKYKLYEIMTSKKYYV